ncbi:MAG TPA: aldehyde dehydrogenase family protein, partial [Chitinophagaceae bacterium]
MDTALLPAALEKLRSYYNTGDTRGYLFRIQQLQRLKTAILSHETALYDALHKDLGKSREESWITEIGFVINEIDHTIARLHHWMKPEKVRTNLINLPSRSYVYKEPLGVVLIIGPWNYPLQLLFSPLVGALAAGNCVVLKPSEYAEATAAVMNTIISSAFSTDYVLYTPGDGAVVVPAMMKH